MTKEYGFTRGGKLEALLLDWGWDKKHPEMKKGTLILTKGQYEAVEALANDFNEDVWEM